MKPHYPEFPKNEIERTEIYKQVFPGEEYNEKKLKNLVIDLTRLAEELLIDVSAAANESESIRMIANQYKERKRDKLFLRTLNILENKLNKSFSAA